MRRATKRRVVVAAVLAVAIWPGFHFALAARTNFNPWELFGWAMYSLPEVRFDMRLEYRDRRDVWHPFIPRGPDLEAYLESGRLRANLGELTSLEPLAQALFVRHPTWTGLAVIEQRWHLDRHTARLDHTLTRSEFERSGKNASEEAAMLRVKFEEARDRVAELFKAENLDEGDAALLAEIMTTHSLAGVPSHGLHFVRLILSGLGAGRIDPQAKAECVSRFSAWEQWDGHQAPGPLSALLRSVHDRRNGYSRWTEIRTPFTSSGPM